jgi:RNA polymerase subunit RPABC4/transcription elongation factor Spt4
MTCRGDSSMVLLLSQGDRVKFFTRQTSRRIFLHFNPVSLLLRRPDPERPCLHSTILLFPGVADLDLVLSSPYPTGESAIPDGPFVCPIAGLGAALPWVHPVRSIMSKSACAICNFREYSSNWIPLMVVMTPTLRSVQCIASACEPTGP